MDIIDELRSYRVETDLASWRPEICDRAADCIIRILDWAGNKGVDMDAIIREKMAYNRTRPYRHGGKVL